MKYSSCPQEACILEGRVVNKCGIGRGPWVRSEASTTGRECSGDVSREHEAGVRKPCGAWEGLSLQVEQQVQSP